MSVQATSDIAKPEEDAGNRKRRSKRDRSVGAKGSRTPVQIAMGRLARDPIAMISLGVTLFFVLVAVTADFVLKTLKISPYVSYEAVKELGKLRRQREKQVGHRVNVVDIPPSWDHPFSLHPRDGTDLFAMWLKGSQPSLEVSLLCTACTLVVGVSAGLLAGFVGGWVDRVISWIVDFTLSLPYLMLLIALQPIIISWFIKGEIGSDTTAEREAGLRLLILVFSIVLLGWAGLARLIRGEVISLREAEFVQAARALGMPTRRILVRELLPNMVGRLIVWTSMAIPAFVSVEAGLSLLGVGLKPPTVSWGQTIEQASHYWQEMPIFVWLPVFGIALLVLSLSLFGDALSDAFNPHTRR